MKYTIKSCIKTGDRQSDFGQMSDYALSLVDSSGVEIGCTLSQKATTPIPSGEIEGDIEDSKWGKKFKKSKSSFGGGFGGAGAKSIPREHAQEMALKYCDVQVALGALKSLSKEALLPLIDWFEKDAQGASSPVSATPKHDTGAEYIPQDSPDEPEIDIDEIQL